MVNNIPSSFRYAKGCMDSSAKGNTLPSDLRGQDYISDTLMNAHGIYSREDIEEAKFHNYSRFGRVLDPYGKVNGAREYLFFVKPDLHICKTTDTGVYTISPGSGSFSANNMTLNPQLDNNPYFRSLLETNPEVVRELQKSCSSNVDPFSHLLSFTVSSNLALDSSSAKTIDNPSTIFNTHYNYLLDTEDSDESYQFSLEFIDDKYLNTYHFFKAYSEYGIARKSGLITPPTLDYYRYRRLHNTMGIYKFIVGEDMETLLYWAYMWGVIPTSCPRDAFGDTTNLNDGLTFSVNFEAAFVEDLNPMILYSFNNLMSPVLKQYGCDIDYWLPVVKQNLFKETSVPGVKGYRSYDTSLGYKSNTVDPTEMLDGFKYDVGATEHIDGRLPVAALVDNRMIASDTRKKYRLRWYPKRNTYTGV